MGVGAVYVSSLLARSGIWLSNRLLGSSGDQRGQQDHGQATPPRLQMLQYSSSEEETERPRGPRQEDINYAASVDMGEVQAMVERSRIIQADPHNKMHGRRVENWHNSQKEAPKRAVRIHTSDQLPRRRKKKNKEKKVERTESDEERLIERARRAMLETTGNLYGASSSMSRVTRSGFSKGACGLISSSQGMSSQTGSSSASHHQDRLASSQNMPSSSGLQAAAGCWWIARIEYAFAVGL